MGRKRVRVKGREGIRKEDKGSMREIWKRKEERKRKKNGEDKVEEGCAGRGGVRLYTLSLSPQRMRQRCEERENESGGRERESQETLSLFIEDSLSSFPVQRAHYERC